MAKKDLSFTTTEGRVVEIRPVSQVLINLVGARVEKDWRARGEPIDPPTYETTTAAGVKETLPWTAEMADAMDAETRAKWDEHIAAVEGMKAETRLEQGRVWLLQGVVVPENLGPDSDPNWKALVGFLKLDVPEDPTERRLMYYETAIFKTPADIIGVTKQIMMISADGVSEEELAAIEDLFRRAVEGNAAPKPAAGNEGAVDDEPAVPPRRDRKGVGKDAE